MTTLMPKFQQTGATTNRPIEDKLRESVSVKDFGAVGDGVSDDTVAIQTALTYLLGAGGGTLLVPKGTYLVTGLSIDWVSANTTIRIQGAGKNATVFQKSGVTTDAVFSLTATPGDGSYSEFSDFSVVGIVTCDGFTITNMARCTFKNLRIRECDAGIENLGSLINAFYDCDLLSNSIGYRSRQFGVFYANVIEFFGGSARANTGFGFDIGASSCLRLTSVDIEANGTTGVVTTGAMVTRSTCDDEVGYANISIENCWFEANKGTTITCEACAGLSFSISDSAIYASESGRAMTIGAVGFVNIERVNAPSAIDVVVVAAVQLNVRQSTLYTLTDTSGRFLYQDLTTGAGTTYFKQGTPTKRIASDGDTINSGAGSVTTVTSVAITAFTVSGERGAYHVTAMINDVGGYFVATGLVVFDGTNAVLLNATTGGGTTITLSGLNVQVTQISGVGQQVRYSYLKVA
jgi:hypothetical protein